MLINICAVFYIKLVKYKKNDLKQVYKLIYWGTQEDACPASHLFIEKFHSWCCGLLGEGWIGSIEPTAATSPGLPPECMVAWLPISAAQTFSLVVQEVKRLEWYPRIPFAPHLFIFASSLFAFQWLPRAGQPCQWSTRIFDGSHRLTVGT